MPPKRKPVVFAICGDTHCGSTIGLCPAGQVEGDRNDGVALPEGGRYLPSDGQRWMWWAWLDFLDAAEATAKAHKAELWGIHAGDSREGDHHQTTQIISADEEVQAFIVSAALDPMRKRVKRWYQCKGTPAHVGPGGDDATARWAGAVREPSTGAWAAQEWMLTPNGYPCRIQVRHHGGMGKLPWTQHTSAVRLASQIFHEFADHAARMGGPLVYPHLSLRGHQHRYSDSGPSQPVRVVYLPAFQLATEFVNKISQSTLASIGGLILTVWPDGAYDLHPKLYTPTMTPDSR